MGGGYRRASGAVDVGAGARYGIVGNTSLVLLGGLFFRSYV